MGAIGVAYGDIGTSVLCVFKAVFVSGQILLSAYRTP